MKTYKVLLISMVFFGLLVGAVFTLQTRANIIQLSAKINPKFCSLEDPIPQYFLITLSDFPKGKEYNSEHLDPATLLVGGKVQMAPLTEANITDKHFKFYVIGEELMYWVVLPEIWHMQYPAHTRADVDIKVTGAYYDGSPFEGTCTLTVFTEKEEANNPIPPP